MIYQFHAIYEKDGDWWVASAFEIPGAFSQGKTGEEARENLLDTIRELMLARRELAEQEVADTSGEAFLPLHKAAGETTLLEE